MSISEPTVMIADDEEHVRLFMKAMLSRLNCSVVAEAATGDEALRKYRELNPDLLILDHNMPYKTGDKVMKELLEEDQRARIILLSSVTDFESVSSAVYSGVTYYLRKDLPMEEILGHIRKCLGDIKKEKTGGDIDREV